MKKLLTMGITVLVTALLIASCANPFVDQDGEAVTVTDLTATPNEQSAEISWTEPEGVEFASVRIVYSMDGEDSEFVDVDKAEDGTSNSVFIQDLVGEAEYSFQAFLVSTNGTVATEGPSTKATTLGAYVAPWTPEIAGLGTPGGWGGNGAMTKVSENEWTYNFTSDSDLEILVKDLTTWDNKIGAGTITDENGAVDDVAFGGGNMIFTTGVGADVTITLWFRGQNNEIGGTPQIRVSW